MSPSKPRYDTTFVVPSSLPLPPPPPPFLPNPGDRSPPFSLLTLQLNRGLLETLAGVPRTSPTRSRRGITVPLEPGLPESPATSSPSSPSFPGADADVDKPDGPAGPLPPVRRRPLLDPTILAAAHERLQALEQEAAAVTLVGDSLNQRAREKRTALREKVVARHAQAKREMDAVGPNPCAGEKEACVACYGEHGGDSLVCAGPVEAYMTCVRRTLEKKRGE